MDVKWSFIRSWHAIAFRDARKTLCGRPAGNMTRDDLPAEKSCETCLRIVARLADA